MNDQNYTDKNIDFGYKAPDKRAPYSFRIPAVLASGLYDGAQGKDEIYQSSSSAFVELVRFDMSRVGSTTTTVSVYFRFPGDNSDGSEDMLFQEANCNPFLRYEAEASGVGISLPPGTSILLDTTGNVDIRYLLSGFIHTRLER